MHEIEKAADAVEREMADLRAKLAVAVEALDVVASWRQKSHAYDEDMGYDLRKFDDEDIDMMEAHARAALAQIKGGE